MYAMGSMAITPRRAVTYGGWYPSERQSFMRRGFGDAAQSIQQLGGAATPLVTTIAAPTVAHILGVTTAVAVPIIGAAIVGVTIGVIELIKLAKGCGQTCIVTSQWANQAEDLLKQNLAAYMALPIPRPISARNAAINNFQVIWAQLQQLCGQPGTQDAGIRCIADRQQGACKWRDASGQCWNWFTGYYDPIANDPHVVDDSVAAQVSSVFGNITSGGNLLPLAIGAGLLLAAVTLS